MNPKYFKDQICEELEGACAYLRKAIDNMTTNRDWAEQFKHMAEAEEHHATTLYRMFVEMYADSQGNNAYMNVMRENIMDCFSSKMRKIEDYKTTYHMIEQDDRREL